MDASTAMNTKAKVQSGRLSTFLVLAPTSSSNYPASPKTLSPVETSPVSPTDELSSPVVNPNDKAVPEVDVTPKERRSSSVSSNTYAPFRFLKLGPVHFGKGDGATDYAETE